MNKAKGFTLVELLATLTIAGALFSVGVPSLRDTVLNHRMNAGINDMITEINLARSEAIKRGTSVVICPSNDAGTQCQDKDTSDSSPANWLMGWLIYSDVNNNASYDSGTDEILRKHAKLTEFKSIKSKAGNTILKFTSDGFAPGIMTTISFCDTRGISSAKGLVIIDTGRVRSALTKDLSCT